jgi:hypothetical protein
VFSADTWPPLIATDLMGYFQTHRRGFGLHALAVTIPSPPYHSAKAGHSQIRHYFAKQMARLCSISYPTRPVEQEQKK